MRKAFSLIELIFVIIVISVITSFLISKFFVLANTTVKKTIKSDIALIKNAISKKNSENILLNEEKITYLDEATTNQKGLEIFDNILQTPLISTNQEEKELGKWIKTSSNIYEVYFLEGQFLQYEFKNNSFLCISEINLCKEFE